MKCVEEQTVSSVHFLESGRVLPEPNITNDKQRPHIDTSQAAGVVMIGDEHILGIDPV